MNLKIANKLVFICITVSLLSACQKEADFQDSNNPSNGDNGELIDDWNFVNLGGIVNTTVSFTESGLPVKAVAFSDYVSQNNTGTLEVTASQFIFSGIGHTINDEMNIKFYLSGLLVDEADSAFNATSAAPRQQARWAQKSGSQTTLSR